MSPLTLYKQFELAAVGRLRTLLSALGAVIRRTFRTIVTTGQLRITVMVIPHSVERKVASFRISVFSLVFAGLMLAGVVGAALASRAETGTLSRLVANGARQLSQSQASLEAIQSRISVLDRVGRVFKTAMHNTTATLHMADPGERARSDRRAEHLEVVLRSDPSTQTRDLLDLHRLARILSASVRSMEEIAAVHQTYTRTLQELPSMWPVKGGGGIITTYFGPAIEPFTHSMYLHLGIDIGDAIGTPLVAAGDGTVVDIEYQPLGYGKYVLIRHRFGFYTRYAHMSRIFVYVGERVKQGQVIGLMGDTGLSTGPHVHFEIHLGDQIIDPMSFMDIDSRNHPSIYALD